MNTLTGSRKDQTLEQGVEARDAAKALTSSSTQSDTRLDPESNADIPFLFHAIIIACLVTMVFLFKYFYEYYALISQEDHLVEWATVVLYLPAAFIGIRYGIRRRRLFDGLVGLFCFFVAGEEFSWGQRLFGLQPPKLFLEENVQQEISLHNFFGTNVHDAVFVTAVLGYGVLLPLLARNARTRRLLDKIGATAPPIRFAPWCLFLCALYVWYPMHLSSEWIETIVAALFLAGSALLVSKRLTTKAMLVSLALVLLVSAALTEISNAQARRGDPERVACAQVEVQNLLSDIVDGGAAKEKLLDTQDGLHRRIWIAEEHDYLDGSKFQKFNSTHCTGAAAQDIQTRHRYATDPWGLSYWFYTERLADGQQQLTIYSFGANRRRDSSEGTPGGDGSENDDDIAATAILSRPGPEHAP